MANSTNTIQSISDINEAMKRACCSSDIRFLQEKIAQFEDLSKGYSGREILELLQNADDAYSEYLQTPGHSKPTNFQGVKVLIKYDSEHLIICNKGKPFDLDRVHILCQGSLSNKEKVIGCKGKGFRALLNFSENITIHSGNLAFNFSREFADSQGDCIKDSPRVKEVLNKGHKYPILFAPKDLSQESFDKGEWDTIIDIKLSQNDTVRSNIEEQLEKFNTVSLLFLPNISVVEINKKGKTTIYKKSSGESHKYLIEKNVDGVIDSNQSSSYYFFEEKKYVKKNGNLWTIIDSDDGDSQTKLLHTAIAIPEREKNFQTDDLPLFSYFPIREEQSPFYAILHATFELNEYRDKIIPFTSSNDLNVFVAKKLLKFYVNKIKEYFNPNNFGNYAIELLTPIGFDIPNTPLNLIKARKSFITDMKLLQYYLTLIKEDDNILCSITQKTLSKKDDPIYLEHKVSIPQCLKSNTTPSKLENIVEFERSLPHYENIHVFSKRIFRFVQLPEESLKIEVRKVAQPLSPKNRAEVVHWWQQNFGTSVKTIGILKDDKGNFILDNEKCFFTATITGVPTWAKENIQIINKNDEDALFVAFQREIQIHKDTTSEPNSKRVLKDLIYIADQSNLENVVGDVNKSIKTRDNAIEFIQWLYQFYYALTKEESKKKIRENDSLLFPTPTSYKAKINTYLGQLYGNEFAEIISPYLGMEPIAKFSDFNTDRFSWTEQEANEFFNELEITTLPK